MDCYTWLHIAWGHMIRILDSFAVGSEKNINIRVSPWFFSRVGFKNRRKVATYLSWFGSGVIANRLINVPWNLSYNDVWIGFTVLSIHTQRFRPTIFYQCTVKIAQNHSKLWKIMNWLSISQMFWFKLVAFPVKDVHAHNCTIPMVTCAPFLCIWNEVKICFCAKTWQNKSNYVELTVSEHKLWAVLHL